jgi:asparagine synthase (glutamine-hydrolysing)
MFNEIDGVFAMVIYDVEKNKIIFARDRIGVKPLFIFNNNDYFIISSEAKTINYILNNHPGVNENNENNENSENIIQLPPRSFGIYDLNNSTFNITEYFNMNILQTIYPEYAIKILLKIKSNIIKNKITPFENDDERNFGMLYEGLDKNGSGILTFGSNSGLLSNCNTCYEFV